MKKENTEQILKALLKRALGYDTCETVEEYAMSGEELSMVRKKVTKKNVPPDITAAKLLLDGEEKNVYSDMTDEQLENEKERLLKLLKEKTKGENSKKRPKNSL